MLECAQTQETMARQEMLQIIEKQKEEIRYLKEKLRLNEAEKEQIIENFQVSTSVLLERLKDFEAEKLSSASERPQTATVLSKIGKSRFILTKLQLLRKKVVESVESKEALAQADLAVVSMEGL